MPEFERRALESLRQPLETGRVAIARANAHVSYPARFQLVAAMNPCRCGQAGDPQRACGRAPRCVTDYQARISGPLMDRIDIALDVPAVTPADLALPPPAEGSAAVAARVAAARARQAARLKSLDAPPGIATNAQTDGKLLGAIAKLDAAGQSLLEEAAAKLNLSARGYHRVLRVARTLADLDAADDIRRIHVAEAIGYRRRDANPGAARAA